MLYWRYGEYAGIGAGAHGRVVAGGARHATSNLTGPEAWAKQVETLGHGLAEDIALSRTEEADEALLMGMRLSEGLDLKRLVFVTGYAPHQTAVGELTALGLIERKGSRLNATSAGRPVLNEIVRRLAQALEPVTAEN
jgi:oxygen-independent coproporphyrinogen-3 oxidase